MSKQERIFHGTLAEGDQRAIWEQTFNSLWSRYAIRRTFDHFSANSVLGWALEQAHEAFRFNLNVDTLTDEQKDRMRDLALDVSANVFRAAALAEWHIYINDLDQSKTLKAAEARKQAWMGVRDTYRQSAQKQSKFLESIKGERHHAQK